MCVLAKDKGERGCAIVGFSLEGDSVLCTRTPLTFAFGELQGDTLLGFEEGFRGEVHINEGEVAVGVGVSVCR